MDRKKRATCLAMTLAMALAACYLGGCALEEQVEEADRELAAQGPDVAAPEALDGPFTWQNVSTLWCLDSNLLSEAYTHPCNGGSFQKWHWWGPASAVQLQNLATGFCLDAQLRNPWVTATPCTGSAFHLWRRDGGRWISLETGGCLDTNTAGELYTHECNGGNFQNWQ